jgi:hypothetical protein
VTIPCPFCPGSAFPSHEAARDHIRMDHPDEVRRFLEQARTRRGVHMTDPEAWAAGELLAQ